MTSKSSFNAGAPPISRPGINYKQLFEKSGLEFDVGYRRGVPWQGAQEDFATAAEGGLTLRPGIWTVNSSYAIDFSLAGRPIQYSANLRGQHTKNTTLSVDQIAIGGRSSVRGFDGDAVLLAENGVVLRNELNTPVKLWDGLDTAALFAIDYGRVWGPSDILLTGRKLVGLALGLQRTLARDPDRRRRWQHRCHSPRASPAGELSLYFSLTQNF